LTNEGKTGGWENETGKLETKKSKRAVEIRKKQVLEPGNKKRKKTGSSTLGRLGDNSQNLTSREVECGRKKKKASRGSAIRENTIPGEDLIKEVQAGRLGKKSEEDERA